MQEIIKNKKAKILRYAAIVLKQETEKVNGIETLPLNPENISLAVMERVVPRASKALLTVSLELQSINCKRFSA